MDLIFLFPHLNHQARTMSAKMTKLHKWSMWFTKSHKLVLNVFMTMIYVVSVSYYEITTLPYWIFIIIFFHLFLIYINNKNRTPPSPCPCTRPTLHLSSSSFWSQHYQTPSSKFESKSQRQLSFILNMYEDLPILHKINHHQHREKTNYTPIQCEIQSHHLFVEGRNIRTDKQIQKKCLYGPYGEAT